MLNLDESQRQVGVVAFSSGNFGQGLQPHADRSDPPVRCTIVMPADTPRVKRDRAKMYGADVVLSPIVDGVNRKSLRLSSQ